jgi:hypothetical protein
MGCVCVCVCANKQTKRKSNCKAGLAGTSQVGGQNDSFKENGLISQPSKCISNLLTEIVMLLNAFHTLLKKCNTDLIMICKRSLYNK